LPITPRQSKIDKKEKDSMKTNTTGWEKVLEVGGDEGTLAIYRAVLQDSPDKFVLIRDEVPVEDFDEEVDWAMLHEEYPPSDTFEEAVKEMDSYPWRDMLLLSVHPDYEDFILTQMKLPRMPKPRG
jgi:hypothetical protein